MRGLAPQQRISHFHDITAKPKVNGLDAKQAAAFLAGWLSRHLAKMD